MNKKELVKTLVVKTGLPVATTEKLVMAFLETISEVLASGSSLRMINFGSFRTAKRAARKGTSPQTGKRIDIPASTVAKFRAGKALKLAVNG